MRAVLPALDRAEHGCGFWVRLCKPDNFITKVPAVWIWSCCDFTCGEAALRGGGQRLHAGLCLFAFHVLWKRAELMWTSGHFCASLSFLWTLVRPEISPGHDGLTEGVQLGSDSWYVGFTDWTLSLLLPFMRSPKPPDSPDTIFHLQLSLLLQLCFLGWLKVSDASFWRTGPGARTASGHEPGECDLSLRVREPLRAAVRPPRPPGPGGALQAAALLPTVSVLPGLRYETSSFSPFYTSALKGFRGEERCGGERRSGTVGILRPTVANVNKYKYKIHCLTK